MHEQGTVSLAKVSRKCTSFIRLVGRFQFLALLFGTSTAPELYRREMLQVVEGVDGVKCLQDDIASGKTIREHDTNLRRVLKNLQDTGVTLNNYKCSFRQTEVACLGHGYLAIGISTKPDKVKAINQLDPPLDISEVRSLLGFTNHLASPHWRWDEGLLQVSHLSFFFFLKDTQP